MSAFIDTARAGVAASLLSAATRRRLVHGLQQLGLDALQASGDRVVEDSIAHLDHQSAHDAGVGVVLHDHLGSLLGSGLHGLLHLGLLAVGQGGGRGDLAENQALLGSVEDLEEVDDSRQHIDSLVLDQNLQEVDNGAVSSRLHAHGLQGLDLGLRIDARSHDEELEVLGLLHHGAQPDHVLVDLVQLAARGHEEGGGVSALEGAVLVLGLLADSSRREESRLLDGEGPLHVGGQASGSDGGGAEDHGGTLHHW
mmetsp:Transcript_9730/g.21377  ORF Transcript_9730/g.21377 Transcript_9730/m.21377 type:complete len:254 (-) Transcript_9730:83-844(-)